MYFKKTVGIILSFLIVMFTGCENKNNISNNPKTELEGSINIWTTKENIANLNLSASNYNKLHSKVSINITEMGADELLDKLQIALISKEKFPDILCINDEDVQRLLSKHAINFEDTSDDLKKENYLKHKIDNLTFDGKLFGFPFTTKPAVVAFKVDALEASQINLEYIKTWEDYIALKMRTALPFEDERLYRAFLNQLGGSYFDKDRKLELNSTKAVRAFEMLKKLHDSELVKDTKSFEEAYSLFINGHLDSVIASSEDVQSMYKSSPELKGKLAIIKPPAFEEGGNQAFMLGGSNLMVLNSAKNKSLSLDFTKFIAENRNNIISIMTELGVVPAYTYYNDEKGFGDKNLLELSKELYGINYTQEFYRIRDSLDYASFDNLLKAQDIKTTLDEIQKDLSIQIE